MTREEARVLLKTLNNQVTSAFYDGDFWVEEGTFEAFEVADAALRGPEPDPETGLVPCWCGGKAMLIGLQGYSYECVYCGTSTKNYEEEKRAKTVWNTAMGWRVEG